MTGGGSGGLPGTGGGGPRGPRTGGAGGVDIGHWSHWWYANRVFLVEHGMRVRSHATTTGDAHDALTDVIWRADARRALARALSDADDEVVAAAVLALGKAGDASDIPLVEGVVFDDDRGLPPREAAAMALGLLAADTAADAKEARDALRRIASDEKLPNRFRAIAVYSLGLRHDDGAVPYLVDVARSGASSWDLPAAGVSALGLSGSPDVRTELERLLRPVRRGNETVRRVYAAHGLAKLGAVEALPALLVALGDDDEQVRRGAALAIGAVASAAQPTAVEALVKALHDDKDRATRAMAAVSLGIMGGDVAVAELKRVYDREDPAVRPFAAVALGVIARRSDRPRLVADLLHDLKRGTRHELLGATCVAVGLAGLSEAAPQLRELVTAGGDPQVVAQAAVSLGLIGDREKAPELLRKLLVESNDPMLRGEVALALGMLGDLHTLVALDDMVQQGKTEHERVTGLLALGRIGGAESADLLTTVLCDRQRSGLERHMAGNALGFLLDQSEGRRVGEVAADLNWHALTPTVFEILSEF